MLTQLHIKNFTLIDLLDIEFGKGFSVMTGETGAGKSIILGAIALLLGQRADSKAIKQGADRCTIEAHFCLSNYDMQKFFDDNDIEYDETDCIVRRELTATGKSRAFINDTPVAISLLKELGEQLVDVHSQHQNLLLQKHDFQLSVVDTMAQDGKQLADYQKAYSDYRKTAAALEELRQEIASASRQQEFLQFQYNELKDAGLTEGEQEELEQQSATMTHAEDIKTALYDAANALSEGEADALSLVRRATQSLNGIANVMPATAELAERLESCRIELKDIADEMAGKLDAIDFDPSQLDNVNNRLDRLYDLQKKYRAASVTELISMRDALASQLDNLDNSDERLAQLQQLLERQQAECQKQAEALSMLRKKAAGKIEQQLRGMLVPLGMPNVRFQVDIEPTALSATGADAVSFLFSANTSTPLLPIAQVASGGEIARVMLSLKAMISGAVKLPTIIFDEIDTGVSGKIAEAMAHMMRAMGDSDRQVISITHLPQIAALGTAHYRVEKSETAHGTSSTMHRLTDEERISEVAQMLSGSDITQAAIANARELLGM